MKRLITIFLALIMTLFTAPKRSVEQPHLNAVKTPQTAITVQAEQVPEESETTAETAFVGSVSKTGTSVETEETAMSENEATLTEAEVSTVETTVDQETPKEESEEINEETIITELEEETVECIDEGNQSIAEYKPQIGNQPNPFENDTPTEIDDRPVEDHVGEDEERPGEGKHF
jgi:hypothetical protein